MSAVGVDRPVPHGFTLRRSPAHGEIGSLSGCPLCANDQGHPPCLACRDELRARLLEMTPQQMPGACWN